MAAPMMEENEMQSKLLKGIALVGLAVIIGVTSTLIVMSTPSGYNAGWTTPSTGWRWFAPQHYKFHGSASANASIYCPGIKADDEILMVLEFDSLGADNDVNDLTDSTYVWDDDTIRCGTAISAGSDVVVQWQKVNN